MSAGIHGFEPPPPGSEQYPAEFIEANGAIKLREEDGLVEVGIAAGAPEHLADALRAFHRGSRLVFHELERAEIAAYLGSVASETPPATRGGTAGEGGRILLEAPSGDAPVVALVNSICIEAIRGGASDIHIEALEGRARVRYRLDGTLATVRELDSARFPAIASRIKIMAKLNIMERRLPQDGRISVEVGGRTVELRVSIVPIAAGESIVMRIFDNEGSRLGLGELGLSEDHVALIRSLLRIPHGLVLVTGPTGSGKTTTLGAMLRELSSERLKIVTIEDPVECIVDGASQIQTNDRIGLGFEGILRRVLRQDPDAIMVGEIRDAATAELAVRAALTGHLVLSTLHANSSVSVIPRLRNLGVDSYLVASVLRGSIAQRLVRKVCPDCARPRPPDEAESLLFRSRGLEAETIAEGRGCERCRGTGYRSRTAIAEMFRVDADLEEAILREERVSRIVSRLEKSGMRSLELDGLAKVARGITTLRELETEVAL